MTDLVNIVATCAGCYEQGVTIDGFNFDITDVSV